MEQKSQKVVTQILSKTNVERLGLIRNTFLSGAALATAVLVALTQVGANELSLKIAVVGCSVAAPIWLCLGTTIEMYMHLGEAAYKNLSQLRASHTYTWLQIVSAISFYISLCGIVYFLLPIALVVFFLSSTIGVVFFIVNNLRLTNWFNQN